MVAKFRFCLLGVVLATVFSCGKDEMFDWDPSNGESSSGPALPGRVETAETRKVMLLYEAGFNSLSEDIKTNIETLREGYLPGPFRNDDVLLVFSHTTVSNKKYSVETSPVLYRLYREGDTVCSDTVKVWPAGTSAANAGMVQEVFNLVRDEYPAAGYGAVFSSHATGWLPEGYFNNPKRYEGNSRNNASVWSAPVQKSFGQEYYNGGTASQEIEIADLARAIPYHLDYIFFDACLMATVEVAYEFRDVCAYIAFAPTEIPAAGFDYSTLVSHLLEPEIPDLQGVCEDYYLRYKEDATYGATISMVDCGELANLASVCQPIFNRYRMAIRSLDGSKLQRYDRLSSSKGYYIFFDMKDILREAGATTADLDALQAALDRAVVYEAHTPRFITVPLERCCGLAMYLPSYTDYRADTYHGTAFLDRFYRENIAWNDATALVL